MAAAKQAFVPARRPSLGKGGVEFAAGNPSDVTQDIMFNQMLGLPSELGLPPYMIVTCHFSHVSARAVRDVLNSNAQPSIDAEFIVQLFATDCKTHSVIPSMYIDVFDMLKDKLRANSEPKGRPIILQIQDAEGPSHWYIIDSRPYHEGKSEMVDTYSKQVLFQNSKVITFIKPHDESRHAMFTRHKDCQVIRKGLQQKALSDAVTTALWCATEKVSLRVLTSLVSGNKHAIVNLSSTKNPKKVYEIDTSHIQWLDDHQLVISGNSNLITLNGGLAILSEEKQGSHPAQDICDCCKTHKTSKELSYCGRCKQVRYCSKECQKRDWSVHKGSCKE